MTGFFRYIFIEFRLTVFEKQLASIFLNGLKFVNTHLRSIPALTLKKIILIKFNAIYYHTEKINITRLLACQELLSDNFFEKYGSSMPFGTIVMAGAMSLV